MQVRKFLPTFISIRNDTCDILRHLVKRALRKEEGGVYSRLRSFIASVSVHCKTETGIGILADLTQVMPDMF
jgi:hypothetical protein